MDCIFCQLASGKISKQFTYADESVIAFADIKPMAPHHQLIIPRQHIATLNDTTDEHVRLLGHLLKTARHLAKQLNIADSGYRLVLNCNQDGGQSVGHIHLHLLGGRALEWPPG